MNGIDEFGLINSKEALKHYKEGTKKPLRMPFQDIDTSSVSVKDFPQVAKKLKKPVPGTYEIKWHDKNDNLPFSTSGDQAAFLGDVSLKLEGTLKINPDKSWSFTGDLKCFDDVYDANSSTHRGFFGEFSTKMLSIIPGKKYDIEIRGSKRISENSHK